MRWREGTPEAHLYYIFINTMDNSESTCLQSVPNHIAIIIQNKNLSLPSKQNQLWDSLIMEKFGFQTETHTKRRYSTPPWSSGQSMALILGSYKISKSVVTPLESNSFYQSKATNFHLDLHHLMLQLVNL